MTTSRAIDGVLLQWGDRLFYPGNRVVRGRPTGGWPAGATSERAAAIRARIEATVVRRAQQVMVKVTGGGRGIRAIAAHFRYISKNGRLDIEDESGQVMRGKSALRELVDDWRFGGTLIDDVSARREAFNIMLSMPRGVSPLSVHRAAREFAQTELAGHKYVMVLHDHQANPHVHISVRAESVQGPRLNPRKADLQRWRETFAEKLRGWGVDAEATRQATRGLGQNYEPLWKMKAREQGRLRSGGHGAGTTISSRRDTARAKACEAWQEISRALASSTEIADRCLAQSIVDFWRDVPPTAMGSPRLTSAERPPIDRERNRG